jgi:uncharacterized membrane protein
MPAARAAAPMPRPRPAPPVAPPPPPEPESEPEMPPLPPMPAAQAPAAPEPAPLSEAELTAMFKDQPEPELLESLSSEKAEKEEPAPTDIEKIPDPEPIPQSLAPAEAEDEEQPKKKGRLRLILLIVVAVLLIGALAGLFLARHMIMAALPWTAAIYGAVGLGESLGGGLDIRNVRSERETEGGIEILYVRGVVANVSDKPREVPLIRVVLYDASGKEVQSTVVTPAKPQIEAGGNIAFRGRISDPSPLARRIEVTFVKTDPKDKGKDKAAAKDKAAGAAKDQPAKK